MKNTILIIVIIFLTICWGFTIYSYQKELNKPKEIIRLTIIQDDLDIVLAHLIEYEDFCSIPYDSGRYIGYGHQILPNESFTEIDKQQAKELLIFDYTQKLAFVKQTYGFTGNKAMAVALLCFRWGEGNLLKSKLHKYLLENDVIGIVREWSEINKYCEKNHVKVNERMNFELKLFFKN